MSQIEPRRPALAKATADKHDGHDVRHRLMASAEERPSHKRWCFHGKRGTASARDVPVEGRLHICAYCSSNLSDAVNKRTGIVILVVIAGCLIWNWWVVLR